jgi:D-3-phosphoglycerate dehydrogenase / 2-oxoglutarate reductase
MNKILVTPRSLTLAGDPALDLLRDAGLEVIFCTPGKQPDEEELISLLPGCIGYLAGVEKISAGTLEAAADLKVISRNGVGVDNVDLKAAEKLGIQVKKAAGANARGVAELAITLILTGIRHVSWSDAVIKKGDWQRKRGIEVAGKTLGVVGCGMIGKITSYLALGLGMNVLAYDLFPDKSFSPRSSGPERYFKFAALDDVYAGSDFISLHCPPPDDGKALINKDILAGMKQGVFIVNTARAALVDNADLLESLESGKLSGYATDVYETEPPGEDPLLKHENVITTPHIGGFTEESVSGATRAAVGNLLAVIG